MKKILSIVFLLIFIFPQQAAASDYVLPYPSAMPGSKFYQVEIFIQDYIMKYWYFGNFGQFTYHLKQADKYLVEAKTLFEYKQYLLAIRALQKSDRHFQQIPEALQAAQKENKEVTGYKRILIDASTKHIEVLTDLRHNIPEKFIWRPEKSAPTTLLLKENIDQSIQLRKDL